MTDPISQPTATPRSRISPALAGEVLEQSLSVVPTIDLRDIGTRLLAPLVHATGATRASLMLVNPDTGKLRIVAGLGLQPDLIGRDVDWRPSSISEWVFRKRQGLVLNGAVHRDGLVGTSEGLIESAMCVPLESDDAVLGVVNLASTGTSAAFCDDEMQAVRSILPPVAAAVERALHANQCSRNTRMLELARGLTGRTLLSPGRHEARNYEIGFARCGSAHEGGAVCERVPLVTGGHALIALDPREQGVNALLSAAFVQGVFAASAAVERSASAIVQRINTELCARLGGAGEMGLWVGVLSGSGALASCNAGFAAPVWVPADDSDVVHLSGGGPMVGSDPRARWDEEQVRLLPGDLVVAVSAGVLGARNVTGQPFGPARLAECIAEAQRQQLDTLTESIVSGVTRFSGRPVPTEDLSVLAVRFSPGD